MSDELTQADREAMLIAETAALSVSDPTVWQHFMERWTADVKRRIDEQFADASGGSAGQGSGELPDLATTAIDGT